MKSKNSFFNKTLFKKNITLYWPLWSLYTVVLLFALPFNVWISNNVNHVTTYGSYGISAKERLADLQYYMDICTFTAIIAGAALVFGMALFNYLFNSKSANMIHSLPVDRNQLFGTNVVSGLLFLIVPLFASALITILVAAGYGFNAFVPLVKWFLIVSAIAFVFFAIVTVSAMITGHFVALPIYAVAINSVAYWIYLLLSATFSAYAIGVSGTLFTSRMTSYFSPFIGIYDNVGLEYKYDGMWYDVYGEKLLAAYVVAAIALYVVAYFFYKKRQVEQAGEVLTVTWLKPIFRWMLGTTGGVFGAFFVFVIVEDACAYQIPVAMLIPIMIILGSLSYFIADMIVKKDFHVFKKKNWLGCGKFVVVLVAFFLVMFAFAKQAERKIPNAEDVAYVYTDIGYQIKFDDEDIKEIIKLHEIILENIDKCESIYSDAEIEWMSIRYIMKDGTDLYRTYLLPTSVPEFANVLNTIHVIENVPENFAKHLFGVKYDEITMFGDGYVAYPDKDTYQEFALTSEETEILYKALLADVFEGNLMQYSLNYKYEELEYSVNTGSIEIYYWQKPEEKSPIDDAYTYSDVYMDDGWRSRYVDFGPECTNIIQALIDLGIINSADEIVWEY